jgi:hypothetical protein
MLSLSHAHAHAHSLSLTPRLTLAHLASPSPFLCESLLSQTSGVAALDDKKLSTGSLHIGGFGIGALSGGLYRRAQRWRAQYRRVQRLRAHHWPAQATTIAGRFLGTWTTRG